MGAPKLSSTSSPCPCRGPSSLSSPCPLLCLSVGEAGRLDLDLVGRRLAEHLGRVVGRPGARLHPSRGDGDLAARGGRLGEQRHQQGDAARARDGLLTRGEGLGEAADRPRRLGARLLVGAREEGDEALRDRRLVLGVVLAERATSLRNAQF